MSRKKATGKPVGNMIGARIRRIRVERKTAQEYHEQRARHIKRTEAELTERVRLAAEAAATAEEESKEQGEEQLGD